MMKVLAGTLLAAALLPAAASAGTYRVYACDAGGKLWDNRSWAIDGPVPGGMLTDTACPDAGQNIDLHALAGAKSADDSEAGLVFRTVAGTTIQDFRLNRRLIYNDGAVDNAHPYYALYKLGPTIFAGAGEHASSGALAKQGAWYANPSDTRGVVTRASFPALAGYKGDANALSLRLGCAKRGSPCQIPAGGVIQHTLLGAEITVSDTGRPTLTVAATGLLAGGQRNGSDPVTVTAGDASGIHRVEIVDVTAPTAPRVVGFEEYDPAQPGSTLDDANGGCSWRLTKPCPSLAGEVVRPTTLEPGHRQLLVRAFDAAANSVDAGPFDVDVVSPSDRGEPNGAGAGETAVLVSSFAHGVTRRTVSQNARVKVTGRLRAVTGAPIAGARLDVLTRDLHRETFVDRGTVTTAADGTFSYTAVAFASRQIQFGWLARTRDTRFAANSYLALKARARATLHAPRSVRLGRTLTLTGRLSGLAPSRVPALVAQGRSGRRRFETFRLGRASTRGTFHLRYRFRNPASRGRTFSIRVLVLPRGGWPYEDGVTRTVRVKVR